MKKGMFISIIKEVYLGTIALAGFRPFQRGDMDKYIKEKKDDDYYKCNVCEDVYIGKVPPTSCPTCLKDNSFKTITKEEFNIFINKYFIDRESPGLFFRHVEMFTNFKS